VSLWAMRPAFSVVPAFFWVVPTCGSLIPVSRLFNEFNQSLTRGRVGDAVGWFCPDSRFGRIVPLELVTIIAGGDAHCVVEPFPRQGVWGQGMLWVSSSAGSASSRSPARPTGRRDAGVVWAEGFTFRLESEDDWVGIAPRP